MSAMLSLVRSTCLFTSLSEDREKKIIEIKEGDDQVVVCTTVLERGITAMRADEDGVKDRVDAFVMRGEVRILTGDPVGAASDLGGLKLVVANGARKH